MEQILKLVKDELTKVLNKPIDDMDVIPIEVTTDLLESEGLPVYSDFKDSLTTPWSIAKYIQLSIEEKDLIERVKKDLKDIPSNIDMSFIKRLSCNIQFSKQYVEGAKHQILIIKYYLDEDDNIQYKLTNNGNNFCWDITKSQFLALLANEGFISEKLKETSLTPKKKSLFKRIFKGK